MTREQKKKLLIAAPLAILAVFVVFLLATYVSIASGFTEPAALINRNNGLTVLDRNGVVLFEFDREAGPRAITPLLEISPHLIDSTVAAEDAEFWSNPGVNLKGIVRAFYDNVSFWDGGGFLQGGGGSSITQQLAKNLYIPVPERSKRSVTRKIKEAIIAFELDRRYSKEQILEWYLNSLYYGNGAYGVQAASYRYFNKPAADLTPVEAAMLAGIPRAPAIYDPLNNLDAALARQHEVIDLMQRHDYLSKEEAAQLKAQPLTIREGRVPGDQRQAERGEAPHLAVNVRGLLPSLIGDAARKPGLRVTTSIDVELQRKANAVVQEQLARIGPQVGATNAALVAIDPKTGQVLAYVGSRDYFDDGISGQVDNVTALNQPGSTIKPITYVSAFIDGWSPATIVNDEPIRLSTGSGTYTLGNADNRYRGPIPVRVALASSLNPPAVKALEFAGLPDVYDNARRLGLTTLGHVDAYGPAFTLGGADVSLLDLTYVFSVFANYGEQAGIESVLDLPKGSRPLDPVLVLKVEDSQGRTIWRAKQRKERIIPAPYAYMITHVLSDDTARSSMFGLNSPLKLAGREAAVKSGLTDNARDAWTIGYTPELVTGVWVGNANNSPMRGATSTYTAAPIWNTFMQRALEGRPAQGFDVPSGIKFVQVCQTTGLLPDRSCPKVVTEVFAADRVPTSTGGGTRLQGSQATPTPIRRAPQIEPTKPPKPTEVPKPNDRRGNRGGGADRGRGNDD
ncbi:MAG TPA: transglycosylase domain-containing protein [Dehalococcoidia bacterium]|nr:transglycosylase domain-containing protein [Dehalococcoidia bacterium]